MSGFYLFIYHNLFEVATLIANDLTNKTDALVTTDCHIFLIQNENLFHKRSIQ